MRDKVTIPAIKARKHGPKLTMVTAYDAPMARIVDQADIDMILVGDSLATTVLGQTDTLAATVDIMIHHSASVARANPRALIVTDMPWLSYHVSREETIRNAGRLIREGKAEALKLEGGRKRLPMIEAILAAEIPVMGHLGLTPQSFHAMGGYRVQGKDLEAARELIADAKALAQAGAFALVLEGIPDVLAEIITQEIAIPTIGIGAGVHCDGQVLVFHDVLSFNPDPTGKQAKFVRQYAQLAELATTALQQYSADVQAGTFPADNETYHTNAEVARTLRVAINNPQHEQ
ncbi:3-methyl-2-oxobutanoate hydroxymethyltransferase [Dictyobacter arantiisoli]|uniref:3-methyl-2-oxobutanoate hydroxymethyltransferase n=1 Tax=Dictyobacter arantiisoli TaxID=2014874 RepID=A0A5A5TBX3_9CHLR|nr:3-methyl-2-oxobutanoate hydroxymethyltransferase [Dictyobacter arantiisoli]GCF08878.1 3-methyl-2-oxobutanoate hydroxymethyltransferase [Dictyobacter arantiisoli]